MITKFQKNNSKTAKFKSIMKSVFIFSSVLFLFFTSCDIRNNEQKKNNPAIVNVDTMAPTTVQIIDTTYDFKSVKEGEIVEYNYRFKNIGNKPLVIQDAVASCGCTVPEKPDHAIAPGETGYIKVKFNSDRRPGQAHKTITINSNARPEFPLLILKGEVIGKTE